MRGTRIAAVAIGACMALVVVCLPVSSVPVANAPVPGTTCAVLPAANVWHLDVSRLPKHPKSRMWKHSTHAGSMNLHPDFGPPSYGIPYDVVDASHVDVTVEFRSRVRATTGRTRSGPTSRSNFDLGSNELRPAGWTSADAAGLPIFPGLVRWDEVLAGEIDHAIRFTVACTTRRFVWPARHQAGQADRRCPPTRTACSSS